jgi:hypothetical protein
LTGPFSGLDPDSSSHVSRIAPARLVVDRGGFQRDFSSEGGFATLNRQMSVIRPNRRSEPTRARSPVLGAMPNAFRRNQRRLASDRRIIYSWPPATRRECGFGKWSSGCAINGIPKCLSMR